jgi:hypothetical protein
MIFYSKNYLWDNIFCALKQIVTYEDLMMNWSWKTSHKIKRKTQKNKNVMWIKLWKNSEVFKDYNLKMWWMWNDQTFFFHGWIFLMNVNPWNKLFPSLMNVLWISINECDHAGWNECSENRWDKLWWTNLNPNYTLNIWTLTLKLTQ